LRYFVRVVLIPLLLALAVVTAAAPFGTRSASRRLMRQAAACVAANWPAYLRLAQKVRWVPVA